jgi:hypothetical protein
MNNNAATLARIIVHGWNDLLARQMPTLREMVMQPFRDGRARFDLDRKVDVKPVRAAGVSHRGLQGLGLHAAVHRIADRKQIIAGDAKAVADALCG